MILLYNVLSGSVKPLWILFIVLCRNINNKDYTSIFFCRLHNTLAKIWSVHSSQLRTCYKHYIVSHERKVILSLYFCNRVFYVSELFSCNVSREKLSFTRWCTLRTFQRLFHVRCSTTKIITTFKTNFNSRLKQNVLTYVHLMFYHQVFPFKNLSHVMPYVFGEYKYLH